MSFKMIVIDLDGTLLASDGSISARSRAAIARCAAKGVVVILASARPPRSTLPYSQQLDLRTSVINYNGALIQNPFSNDVFYSNPIPVELARDTLSEIKRFDSGAVISAEVDDRIHFEGDRAMSFKRYAGSSAERRADAHATTVESLYEFFSLPDSRPPSKILVSTHDEAGRNVADLRTHLSARFADRLSFTGSAPGLLEIANAGASKAKAVEVLAAKLDFDRGEIAAIGDGSNDVEMIEFAGCGIAMGNACDELKAKAQHVTDSNDRDGVAKAIEQLVLGATCQHPASAMLNGAQRNEESRAGRRLTP